MSRVAVVGHLCVDLTPKLPPSARFAPGQLIQVGRLAISLGGAVANTGLALRDLGSAVVLQAVVGDDLLGVVAEKLLGDGARLTKLPGQATSYSIVLEPQGSDRTFWHHTGANGAFDAGAVTLDADLLHLAYPPLLPGLLANDAGPLHELLLRAGQSGLTTSVDLAVVDPDSPVGALDWPSILDRMLPVTDVISPSVDDLKSMLGTQESGDLALAEQEAEFLVGRGAAIAMVTAGAHGMALRTAGLGRLRRGGRVLAALGDEWADCRLSLRAQSSPVHVTSTGAGDAATAGLLHSLAVGLSPEQALSLARWTSDEIMAGRRPTAPDVDAITIPCRGGDQ